MSYMDHNDAFAPAGGIQELSFDEIEEVSGGFAPIVAAAIAIARAAAPTVAACRASPQCMTAVMTVAYFADKAVDVVIDQIFD